MSADEHFELKIDHIPISNDTIYDFSPGNYVAYVYDQKWYIGSISSIDKEQNELKVSSMHPMAQLHASFGHREMTLFGLH